MQKIITFISVLLFLTLPGNGSQPEVTEVYLLTCGPGTETYSIYGHSALRIVNHAKNIDDVYNWGVFDFSTPAFAWKFAKGRLDYMLDAVTYKGFLKGYFFEKRYVHSQRINLSPEETNLLLSLIEENMKPENRSYRYDFFYDDCSTRIRDLLEKAVGDLLVYPPEEEKHLMPTFREMVTIYQSPYPWLQFGIDLIMGSPGDKKASFRDRMFLPLHLQEGLSKLLVKRENNKRIPLLQNTEIVLDFAPPVIKSKFLTSPATVFTILLVIIIILSALNNKKIISLMDVLIFLIFSILALLMIFFNFFTDHQQMKWNLNIIWLNPFILVCLITLLLNKPGNIWFRIVFFLSAAFLVLHLFLPQDFNFAIFPLLIILLIRTSIRSGFGWNPLSSD